MRRESYTLGDDASAEAGLAAIEHRRLSRRNSPLRIGEFHLEAVRVDARDCAGGIGLAIARLGGNAVSPAWRLRDPARVRRLQAPSQQQRMIVALHHGERVRREVLRGDIPGVTASIAAPADAQALALADGVVHEALVLAHAHAVGGDDVAG